MEDPPARTTAPHVQRLQLLGAARKHSCPRSGAQLKKPQPQRPPPPAPASTRTFGGHSCLCLATTYANDPIRGAKARRLLHLIVA